LAQVLNALILALGLQGVLVIGGFALSIGPIYPELLCNLLRRRNDYSPLVISPDMVQLGELGEHACLRGAAEYALMAQNGSM
jgi:hypothetical protein